jgi:hypothetical protein
VVAAQQKRFVARRVVHDAGGAMTERRTLRAIMLI